MGCECLFHVVSDYFRLDSDGLLGIDALQRYEGQIDLGRMRLQFGPYIFPFLSREKFFIQPKSVQNIYVCIENIKKEEGYIPLLDVHPDLIIGEAIVTNRIWLRGRVQTSLTQQGKGNCHVWATCGGKTYISCYLSPNDSSEVLATKLASIETTVRKADVCVHYATT